jgi:methionyl-tRNA synthetase
MAKDNVPFHTVMFPATQLGVREPWKKVDYVKAFNWLTYYGGKFSTSQKRGVFTDQALDILPADYWRYFLIANAPESDDSSFTWEHFTATVNKDLADTLGNFVNRVLSFSKKRFGEEVPEGSPAGAAEAKLGEEIAGLLAEYEAQMEALQFRKAAAALRALWSAGNSYLEEKAPWLEIKTDQDGAALTLRTAMNLIHLYAVVSEPFIPTSAKAMRTAFDLSDDTATWVTPDEARALSSVPPGTHFAVPPVLFAKLTDDDLQEYTERFGGVPA